MRLVAPYFADDPRPELVEVWRANAESVPRRMALADLEDAMEFLLSRLYALSQNHSGSEGG